MADFTIPYRAFQPVEPDITPGFNALMGVEAMKDRKARTGIAQQQTDMDRERMDMMKRQTELAEKEIPFKWLKQKAAMVGDISGQISQLPPEKRVAKYRDLVEKVIPMPLVEKSPLGPLGVGDPSKLLSPDEFAQLDDKGQKDYLGAQYKTSKDFVQFELEDLQNQNKTNQFRQQYEQDIDKIIKASQLRRGERAQDYAYDSKLMKEKHGYDKDLAGLKGELKGGKDGKGGVEFKAADNAPFFKALEPLYKFEMTEDGGFRFGGTEDEAKEMIAIASRANEIYKEGGTTHTTAAKKAAEEFGKTFPGPKGSASSIKSALERYEKIGESVVQKKETPAPDAPIPAVASQAQPAPAPVDPAIEAQRQAYMRQQGLPISPQGAANAAGIVESGLGKIPVEAIGNALSDQSRYRRTR